MDRFVGKRLDARYEIQEIIGTGKMSVVYKAHDNVEDRIVAIKILKEEFASNEDFIRKFKNKSKAIGLLSHENIVKIYDISFGDLIQYTVMEYIDGVSLKEFIGRQKSRIKWNEALHITTQILKGLQHAHDSGVIHRNINPQNIMLSRDGTVKVTDFEIGCFSNNEYYTKTGKTPSSVYYISPEQAIGEKADEKSDIYSVGIMLYEMLTGQVPFQAESAVSIAIMQLQHAPKPPTEINASIPMGMEQIIMHAMQKNREDRYQSTLEILGDLYMLKKDPSSTFNYSSFVDNSPKRSEKKEKTKKSKKGLDVKWIINTSKIACIIFGVILFLSFAATAVVIHFDETPTKEITAQLKDNIARYKTSVFFSNHQLNKQTFSQISPIANKSREINAEENKVYIKQNSVNFFKTTVANFHLLEDEKNKLDSLFAEVKNVIENLG